MEGVFVLTVGCLSFPWWCAGTMTRNLWKTAEDLTPVIEIDRHLGLPGSPRVADPVNHSDCNR